ncbi:MAG: ABC transporter ATP-binding protein [Candidatus Caldarchaeum sp.]|nr:ABC transporter ATP-binding protein [Candidatus Caldarchaeum sp.]MCS7137264.1 ABC transporter ATP-binding protein [Candidatus Caldarchaeum sp.]MDW7978829.1 ABC transporter ATP-binding protein [Candidatus Caldarchaeum sp.]
MISVRGVSKVFKTLKGADVVALKDVSFDVEEGEFIAIVGPSGCGKSTLLRIVAGLVPPSDGEILIEGRKVDGPAKGVGMVFQTPVLMPWKKVAENILFPLHIMGRNSEANDSLAKLMRLLGLEGFEHAYPFELSGGMQSRVSIGRALITNPKILLMDEPFGALDALTREKMGLELLNIWREYRNTVLFVTHDVAEAVFLADRVVVMTARPGRVKNIVRIELDRPRDLAIKSSHEFAQYTLSVRKDLGLL